MIPIDDQILAQVARDVCETMLGLPAVSAANSSISGPRLVALVNISGVRELVVEVETVRELASHIASTMFSSEPNELNESDLRDALGEVANMVGGNVKGILSGEFDLSLPIVEERQEDSPKDPANGIRVQLTCHGHPLIIRFMHNTYSALATMTSQ